MRSGSELRPRQRMPSWHLDPLPVLLKGILCLATLPAWRGHATATATATFACPLGHRYLWQGCQLDLSPCSNISWRPMPRPMEHFGVPGGYPASKGGVALLAWAGSVPHSGTLQHLIQQAWGRPGWEGPARPGSPSRAICSFVPSGKSRTLLARENQTALCTGTNPWPRGTGQAQTSPFCCIPLYSPVPASSWAS